MRNASPVELDRLLHRHFALVVLALVALAALLAAQGVAHVVGALLGATDKQLSARPLAAGIAPPAPEGHHATSADAILARNPFDSVTGPLDARPPPDALAIDTPPDITRPFDAPDCDGVRVLAIAASSDPDWSIAALEAPQGKGASILCHRGDEAAGKTVRFVGRDRVWMSSGDTLCQARMFKPAPSKSAGSPSPPVASASPGVPEDIKKNVRRVSPTELEIDRGLVDRVLDQPATFLRDVQIAPYQENGRTTGVRLSGIRAESLLGMLGVQSGDRLQKINGFELGSPEQLFEAYARLRGADHLTVNLNRRGQEVNIDVSIR